MIVSYSKEEYFVIKKMKWNETQQQQQQKKNPLKPQ